MPLARSRSGPARSPGDADDVVAHHLDPVDAAGDAGDAGVGQRFEAASIDGEYQALIRHCSQIIIGATPEASSTPGPTATRCRSDVAADSGRHVRQRQVASTVSSTLPTRRLGIGNSLIGSEDSSKSGVGQASWQCIGPQAAGASRIRPASSRPPPPARRDRGSASAAPRPAAGRGRRKAPHAGFPLAPG
jgi:hypothetical protein